MTPDPRAVRPQPLRVIVCDDVAEVRELLGQWFAREPSVVVAALAADGDAALAAATAEQPDVIVTDLGMPGPPRGELVARLHAAAPAAAIVLYSGSSGETLGPQRRLVRLEVPKGIPPRELVARVRDLGAVLRATSGPT